jgi:hypothetical protein
LLLRCCWRPNQIHKIHDGRRKEVCVWPLPWWCTGTVPVWGEHQQRNIGRLKMQRDGLYRKLYSGYYISYSLLFLRNHGSIIFVKRRSYVPDGWSHFAVGNPHKFLLYSGAHRYGVWKIAAPIFAKEYKN